MASKQATKAAADQAKSSEEFDPEFDWQQNVTNYVLRIPLSGFKKEDFRVQVDSAGKLTVRGQRPAGADCKYTRFHKVFQLPDGVNLEEISGRFEANVLYLTVPKKPPATQLTEEIKELDDEAEATKEQDQQPNSAEEKEEEKPKAKPTPSKKAREDGVKPEAGEREVEGKKKGGERVVEESLADMVRRRVQEERAKATAAAAEEEREKKERSGWRGRIAEELEGFADAEWADGLVDMLKKNKEAIATAVAAFSLGLFVSHKLFSRNP